jgi:transposase-like protein
VVEKAVQSVGRDHMALRLVPKRLAQDFWVQPSEKMVRLWYQAYARQLDWAKDYQSWVVAEFSRVLCLDEVYQGELALLLAVDPAMPDGDRLIGYQLNTTKVDPSTITAFLEKLAQAGVQPQQIITDGSPLYPTILAKIWPKALHQLCLFHETRRLTAGVTELAQAVMADLPTPTTPAHSSRLAARVDANPTVPAQTPLAQKSWQAQWLLAQLHALARQGCSNRSIARQLQLNLNILPGWLNQTPDEKLVEQVLAQARAESELLEQLKAKEASPITNVSQNSVVPLKQAQEASLRLFGLRTIQRYQVRQLAKSGLALNVIARQIGLNRETVLNWLNQWEKEAQSLVISTRSPSAEEKEKEQSPAQLPPFLMETAQSGKKRSCHVEKYLEVARLAKQNLSYSEISRQSGVGHISVSSWLKQAAEEEDYAQLMEYLKQVLNEPQKHSAALVGLAQQRVNLSANLPFQQPPPAPWKNWEEVWQLKQLLKEERYLLVRRSEHLNNKQKEQLALLLNSPVGGQLAVLHNFIQEWYRLWRDKAGKRPGLAEAELGYEQWRSNQSYQQLKPLRQLIQLISPQRFSKLSVFLLNPKWQSTNNGAERMGRAFRHRQAPHFNLRKLETIEADLKVEAFSKKDLVERHETGAKVITFCQRGRRSRQTDKRVELGVSVQEPVRVA